MYDEIIANAIREILRDFLVSSKDGVNDNHYLYITFLTRYPGVDISESLQKQYLDEMTIVIQHQYWGLKITSKWFEVSLSFNKIEERLHIPFSAVVAFAGPSFKFTQRFQIDTNVEMKECLFEKNKLLETVDVEQVKMISIDKTKGKIISISDFRKNNK
ncbi:MAG: ClpXP protease specificity-enhancing factor SspB [Rhodospirillaceae bacterium]|jgi:hypothetical protein|nr:ClpXP protease specificity-enhancing factor SspB [Rhodospirillaceae bacterium]